MSMNKLYVAGLLLIGLLMSPLAALAQGALVGADWLKQQLGRSDLRVLDASPASLHGKAHIPGAIAADLFSSGLMDAPAERVEKKLRDWGINPGDRIVVVDQGGDWMGPKLFWDLLSYGLPADRLFLLDGGMAQWRALGGALSSEATPPPQPGSIAIGRFDDSVRVRLPEFLAASADPKKNVLLEALQPSYYFGGAAFFSRAGHVPHATLMPSEDFFRADKRFKPAEEIRRMLRHQGITPEQQVLSYCGGGGAAAVPYFALRFLAGHDKVRLFQESQRGWLEDPRELPVWTYAQPQLLRDSAWVKAFASPMLKAFGLSKVSVIDLRPAEAYAQGHLPTALNLPIQAFQGLDTAALAARLGQLGLDRSHEAVLVSSGGGLNAESALALLMLEQVGQARVSLLLDNTEAWAERGFALARPSGAAAVAKPYPASTAAGPLIRDASQAQGQFPQVRVAAKASGSAQLVLAPAQFIDAAGAPKPAKEIWKLLEKAAVPRYAQLLLVGNEPGEAAINYAVLRLMGFADLKVLVP